MSSIQNAQAASQQLAGVEARENAILNAVRQDLSALKEKMAKAHDDPSAMDGINAQMDAILADLHAVAPVAPPGETHIIGAGGPSDAAVSDPSNTGAPNSPNATT